MYLGKPGVTVRWFETEGTIGEQEDAEECKGDYPAETEALDRLIEECLVSTKGKGKSKKGVSGSTAPAAREALKTLKMEIIAMREAARLREGAMVQERNEWMEKMRGLEGEVRRLRTGDEEKYEHDFRKRFLKQLDGQGMYDLVSEA